MTEERLKEIRERADAATKGPWVGVITADNDTGEESAAVSTKDRAQIGACPVFKIANCGPNDEASRNDAQFIAHARQDIPDLLDLIEELERERDDVFQAITNAYREGDLSDPATRRFFIEAIITPLLRQQQPLPADIDTMQTEWLAKQGGQEK